MENSNQKLTFRDERGASGTRSTPRGFSYVSFSCLLKGNALPRREIYHHVRDETEEVCGSVLPGILLQANQ